jgi:hypothetical protein
MSRLILTLIGVYKVFPTKVKVKVDTITDPFIGEIRTFDCTRAIKDLNIRLSDMSKIKYLKLETASPNAVKST